MHISAVGDVNMDRHLDVVSSGHGFTRLWLNLGKDTWKEIELSAFGGGDVDTYDMDGDGDLDILTTKGWVECPLDAFAGDWKFHPVKSLGGETVRAGPLRYRIRSINKFGKLANDYRFNTAYTIFYDVFPNFIRASVTNGNEYGYACVMELTPGGDSLESTDYVVCSNGEKYTKGNGFAEDIVDEWALIGDLQDSTGLFFIHAQDDLIKDGLNWYDFMQVVMVGWGRGANPAIHKYLNEYYF